jgi:NitT/TauT family transport system ATP-binding protein
MILSDRRRVTADGAIHTDMRDGAAPMSDLSGDGTMLSDTAPPAALGRSVGGTEKAISAKLSLRHIRRVFDLGSGDPTVALDDISLDVAAAEFVAILGPSGCGKSTLLQIAAGLIPASAGEVLLDGAAVQAPPPKLVYLFQQYGKSLFPWRSVVRNVEFALQDRCRDRRERRAKAVEYLRVVGLDGLADRNLWQLSGGMQQRVAIARALAAQPEVLLLDEPFSAVDALTRVELQTLVLDIWRKRRLTIVLVTHDVDEAVFMADRVVMLSRRPAVIGTVREVTLERPRDPITTREDPRFLALRHELLSQLLTRPAGT